MQRELRDVLILFNQNKHISVQKTPEVFISQHSSASEVKEWLKQKNFSESIIRTLAGMDGSELFSCTKEQLEDFCGEKEGKRLHSQLTISRNVSGVSRVRLESRSHL